MNPWESSFTHVPWFKYVLEGVLACDKSLGVMVHTPSPWVAPCFDDRLVFGAFRTIVIFDTIEAFITCVIPDLVVSSVVREKCSSVGEDEL